MWRKKINGTHYYFGRWGERIDGKMVRVEGDGWEAAEALYKAQLDDILAGRTPRAILDDGKVVRAAEDVPLVKHACEKFLVSKKRKREAGEIGIRTFNDYKQVTDLLYATWAERAVDDLTADDFAALRAAMVKRWGPVRVGNAITRVKSVFKFAFDNHVIDRPVRYGSEFGKPSASVLRRHRAKAGVKMFEAEELHRVIDA